MCTVDSEWDKIIIRVLLGATRSRAELEKLGIKSDNIAKDQEYVKEILKERLRAKTAAEDIIKLQLNSRLEKIKCSIESNKRILNLKKRRWTALQLKDLEEETEILESREANVEKLLNSDSTSDAKKVKEMIKRTQNN